MTFRNGFSLLSLALVILIMAVVFLAWGASQKNWLPGSKDRRELKVELNNLENQNEEHNQELTNNLNN